MQSKLCIYRTRGRELLNVAEELEPDKTHGLHQWLTRMESICIDIPKQIAELNTKADMHHTLLSDRITAIEERCTTLEKKLSEFGSLGNIITIGTGIGVSIILHVINMVARSWSGS